jgi:diaminopimelate epimerase
MRLTKHHGLGNDFLVLADPDGTQRIDAAVARSVCDRHRGIGADGLLHLSPGADGAQLSMVLLNADGGRAEMSGNGIGCLVQAAVLAGMASGPTVSVSTDAGRRTVEIRPGESPHMHVATVDMGAADLAEGEEDDWVEGDVLRAMRVSMGNPHLVLQAASAELLDDRERIAALGRRAEETFADGMNVEVVLPGERDGELRMDVYERGVGLTLACGTGACATAAAARRWGLVGDDAVVRMVGGATHIDLSGPEVRMTTPITYVGAVETA